MTRDYTGLDTLSLSAENSLVSRHAEHVLVVSYVHEKMRRKTDLWPLIMTPMERSALLRTDDGRCALPHAKPIPASRSEKWSGLDAKH